MPELPEIETIKHGISSLVKHKITKVIVRNPHLRYPINADLSENIVKKPIISISRRGKYLIFTLSSGYILIHLGMSGSLILLPSSAKELKKHDHVDLYVGNKILRYNDPRRFGMILYFNELAQCKFLQNLGPEPLLKEFNAPYLLQQIANKTSSIKQLIMNNDIVVGVGNIYANEALFMAKIAPTRRGKTITLLESQTLVKAIKQVLRLAIKLGGSSLQDYKQADGSLGYFQNMHHVYNRVGKPCDRCKTKIIEVRLGQRNSFYCPKCQK